MKNIDNEADRLHANPCLFPSAEIRQEFCTYVSKTSKLLLDNYNQAKAAEDIYRTHVEAEFQANEQFFRGTFQPRLTPWQQFLHNKAPGLNRSGDLDVPNGSMQVIPPGGMRLLEAWDQEHCRIARELGAVRVT